MQCENKEAYINSILTLDDACQNALMYLIEKILNKCNQENVEPKTATSEGFKDSFAVTGSFIAQQGKTEATMNNLLAKIEELELENQQLGQRVNDLVQEKEQLKSRVGELVQEVNTKAQDVKNLVNAREGVLKKVLL